MCVTDRHDMTLAVEVASNPNTTNNHIHRRLDLSYNASPIPPMPGKSRAYFEAISLLPRHVGTVLIKCRCIGYMPADHS